MVDKWGNQTISWKVYKLINFYLISGCLKNDVVFLMDSSGSQSPFDFRNQIAFVQDVVKWFQIGTEHVLVSVITFSLDVIEEFPLNKYTKKETLIKAIGNVTYHGLLTNTSGALRYVRLNSFLPRNGGRPQVDKILIVLTDGVSDNPTETIKEAELLRKMDNIKVYAIGIGKRSSHSELLRITGTEDRIQKAPNFDFLSDNLYSLERKICRSKFIYHSSAVHPEIDGKRLPERLRPPPKKKIKK